jgi:hypothetical protein
MSKAQTNNVMSLELSELELLDPRHTQYRSTAELLEIENLIRYFCNSQIPLTAWQKVDDQRLISKVKMVGLNSYSKEIRIECVGKAEQAQLQRFNPDLALNIHGHIKRFVAKAPITYLGLDHLYIEFPEQIHTEETRAKPRKKFLTDQHKVGFLKRDTYHEYPLIDLSETGMAFKVPVGPASLFNYKDDEIQIARFFKNEVTDLIKGNIVYIKSLTEPNKYRVGVRFHRSIDKKLQNANA